ncbi:MAG: S66 peptidase family protein, partial [Peptostreptococcaceae bacterium]
LNKDIDAILCIRGGYGTPRILDMIDYNIIKENPKIFIGFSDITALHNAINQKSNLITFHGPMAGSMLDLDKFTFDSLFNTLNLDNKLNILNPNNEKIKSLIEGTCEGQLVGGNLALLVATMGTKYEIDTKGKILFIEDIGEEIYKLDRMLTQLALGNKFKDCVGIIFGDFCDCNKSNKDDFELEELIIDRVKNYNKPTICNLKSGHCMPMITLALGANYKLDATNNNVKLNMYK